MTWYAAHVIVSIRPIVPDEEPTSVYENVILVEADNPDAACAMAGQFSAVEPGADEGLTIDDKPAHTVVEGIRKVVTVSNPSPLDLDADRPVSGTEITYSRYELKDGQALRDLIAGENVEIKYIGE